MRRRKRSPFKSKADFLAALRSFETPPRWHDAETRRIYLTKIAPLLREGCIIYRHPVPEWLQEDNLLKSLHQAVAAS